MPSIKLNHLTSEIELRGSETFIESNFDKIRDLLIGSFGVKKTMTSRRTEAREATLPMAGMKESQAGVEITRPEPSQASPILADTKSSLSEISQEIKAKRPPLRKYIRKVGSPGHERRVVEVAEEKPKEITLASLKEKFGLSDTKIGGIIRDAERFGKAKRVVNGSYLWSQE